MYIYITYVQGATSHYITSEDEVQQALEVGGQARATAETFMNQVCLLELQIVFSLYRMCSIYVGCVLYIQHVSAGATGETFMKQSPMSSL